VIEIGPSLSRDDIEVIRILVERFMIGESAPDHGS
jgi:hypothetical protein